MNFQWTSTARLISLPARVAVIVTICAFSLAPAQTNSDETYDPLNAFAGTWIAKEPGANTPYLVLKFQESAGSLTGTTTHFKMRVMGKGKISGSAEAKAESSLTNLKVWGSDLGFTWDGDSRLQRVQAKFVAEGTQQASLIFMLDSEKLRVAQEIMKENPGASGFNPVIMLRRETLEIPNTGTETLTQPWEAAFMARLINTAEAQYKSAKGRYADYHTLLQSGQLEETDGHEFKILPEHFRSESDPLPGYRLRLLISPDAGTYQLSIQENTADCGLGIFTDETGIIRKGYAAECQGKLIGGDS